MFVHHKKKRAVELAVFFYPWYKLWPKIYVGLYYYKKLKEIDFTLKCGTMCTYFIGRYAVDGMFL